MALRGRAKKSGLSDRGSTLFIVAGSLTVLLGIGALAIDIASLYVARNESQRAADSAALAGAKVFVESGCVTSGDCTSQEATATDRATQVAAQNLVAGQGVVVGAVTFEETPQNPQITVQVQTAPLNTFFAGAIGITTAPTVGATATAEAFHPAAAQNVGFCTGCVRPWLIPASSLNPGQNQNPGCSGVIGQTLKMAIQTNPDLFGTVDNGTGLAGYQQSIAMCNTGQMTCGMTVTVNAVTASNVAATTAGVGSLLHLPGGNIGPGQGQDWIDATSCPPQIHAGSLNPLVAQGVIAQDARVTTSDSIVTVYVYDDGSTPPLTKSPQVTIVGFAQIFVTQQDAYGDVWGVILGSTRCASNGDECERGSIQGSTMLPVRLIAPAGR